MKRFKFKEIVNYHDGIQFFSANDELDKLFLFSLWGEETYLGVNISEDQYNKLLSDGFGYDKLYDDYSKDYLVVTFDGNSIVPVDKMDLI
jgi:hypothetical protein